MNQKVKSLWTEALRSGEFQRANGTLKKTIVEEKSYCCLGVLCELHRRETGDGMWAGNYYIPDVGQERDEYLPQIVMDWSGLKEEDPIVDNVPTYDSLSEINDSDNFSFEDIADIIEDQL